jgi:hypothetical protein
MVWQFHHISRVGAPWRGSWWPLIRLGCVNADMKNPVSMNRVDATGQLNGMARSHILTFALRVVI